MHAYIALCIGTGVRTEEARALRWDAVALDADVPHVQVWRSVRAHGDTKTEKSRRMLALPRLAAEALQAHREHTGYRCIPFKRLTDILKYVGLRRVDQEPGRLSNVVWAAPPFPSTLSCDGVLQLGSVMLMSRA